MDRRRKDERTSEMYETYQAGKSLEEVAVKFGITRQSVYAAFKVRGYELRPKREHLPCIVFDGNKYTKMNSGYYRKTDGNRSLMHRDIWEHHNGPIPDGWDIHHKDENKQNNDLDNFECLPKDEHAKLHGLSVVRTVCRICGKRNRANSLCFKHWYRNKNYGDPFMTKAGRVAD